MSKERKLTTAVFIFSLILIAIIAALFFMPEFEGDVGFDVTILPLLNAIFNVFTFSFLLISLISIKKKKIKRHRNFILAAFASTFFFLICYVMYHFLTEPTPFGGNETLKYFYLFILASHVILAIVNVPLALLTTFQGFLNNIQTHRKIAKWTMPIWMYVSATGVLVYILISPYY